MYDLMKELFPLTRSITGNGIRDSLNIINKHIPLEISEVPTGTQAFDWTVPKEWNIKDAYIEDNKGKVIVDYKSNNLHVVSYSTPVDEIIDLKELEKHLYSIEDKPDAIPYVTSYYKERWGFCLSDNQRKQLKEGNYRVFIDSELKEGSLSYGELILPGKNENEIFLSTYLCHPSMANNELSGPVVLVQLVKWLMSEPRRFTYRIVFSPEIIGSIVYLSKNIKQMKEKIIAGLNFSCLGVGDEFSFMPSRYGNTLADKVALATLKYSNFKYIKHSFLERGSDERNYCAAGVDLPFVSIMRKKYGHYPEYHTHLDNLNLIKPKILFESLKMIKDCVENFENNKLYKCSVIGEPQLGKRKLYPNSTISSEKTRDEIMDYLNVVSYSDGSNDLIDLCEILNINPKKLLPIINTLIAHGLLEEYNIL